MIMSMLTEKTKKIMNNIGTEYKCLSISEAVQVISQGNTFLILFHVHPDGDSIGSAFALKAALEYIGKNAYCLCADEIPERYEFATQAYQKSVLPSSLPENYSPDMVISVDTASPSQLGSLYDIYKDKIDLMIDHHEKAVFYADYCSVHTSSSCGEVLWSILIKLLSNYNEAYERLNSYNSDVLPLDVAKLIYMAICSDTGCFRYNNVSPHSMRVAASLIERDFDASDINHRLFGIKSLKQMQVEHAGFERMNLYCNGTVAIITFPYDLREQYGATDETTETIIDVARCIKGVEVAAAIRQPTKENRFRVSMRSSTDFDVSEICALYGGGGHRRAAGCTVVSDSILAAEMTIVAAIESRKNYL